MNKLAALFLFLTLLYSCDNRTSGKKDQSINQELAVVVDSISLLMSEYHYNPAELETKEYRELEKKVRELAETVDSKQDFINGFNELWTEGPFSHVGLSIAERRAEEMADFIDSLRVGDHSVSLEWIEETAILNVTTMTGVDTKERVFAAYRDIAENKAKSLIIDLRNNTGGTFAGVPLVGHVLTDSMDAGVFVSRKWWNHNTKAPGISDIQKQKPWHGWSIKSFWHDVQQEPLTRVNFRPMDPHFEGPVYVLTSHKTASAAEFTADALANKKNVTVIGETTEGAMLSQKMFDLPQGFQLSLPIAEYYSTRIGKIEGKGVEPDITIDQSVAMDLALSLIKGEKTEDALALARLKAAETENQPFGGQPLYLFGNMNDWGKKWNMTPEFKYKGNGVFETSTKLKKGRHEFKIAPMDWSFDFGAHEKQENVAVGEKSPLKLAKGTPNLIINIKDESTFSFNLNVSDEKAATLYISKN